MKLQPKVSLTHCQSCYCMTHTIQGKCGKCGVVKAEQIKPVKSHDIEKWEKRFDVLWVDGFNLTPIQKKNTKLLKKFIRSELFLQLQKVGEILFDLAKSYNCEKDTACEFEDRLLKVRSDIRRGI